MYSFVWFLFVLIFLQISNGQIRGPPMVEKNPILLDSFIPASMQIIAYITELMKYDLKPQKPGTGTSPASTTTTTIRPTPPHKPGVFAPVLPPGAQSYFGRDLTYAEYVERLIHPTTYNNYFDRYRTSGRSLIPQSSQVDSVVYGQLPADFDKYLDRAPSEILKLVNQQEEEVDINRLNADEQVQEFSEVYDDSNFRLVLLKQKQKPPTRAYVTLLSLYDLLNKESKKLGLNKYSGYKENVLNELAEISTGTSADQLRLVLMKVSKRRDTNNQQILGKIDVLVKDLEESSSYISAALRYIPPLPFVL